MGAIECHICGACCEILSISSLKKKAYSKCEYIKDDNRCKIYETRPEVCRSYKADEVCYFISDLDRESQHKIFKAVYGD